VSESVSYYYTDHSKRRSNCQVAQSKDGLIRVIFTAWGKNRQAFRHRRSPRRQRSMWTSEYISCRKSRCV